MPPARWLKSPAWANPQAMAIEPSAVTIQESREIAPTCAMLVGSMMMPEPIMFTATMNVSCTTFIFLALHGRPRAHGCGARITAGPRR